MSSEPSSPADPPEPPGSKPKNELDAPLDYEAIIVRMSRGLLAGAMKVAEVELKDGAPTYRIASVATTALISAAAFLCKLVGGETPENEAAFRFAVDTAWKECKVVENVIQKMNAPAPKGVN